MKTLGCSLLVISGAMEAPRRSEEKAGTNYCHLDSNQAEAGGWGWQGCVEVPAALPGVADGACTRVTERQSEKRHLHRKDELTKHALCSEARYLFQRQTLSSALSQHPSGEPSTAGSMEDRAPEYCILGALAPKGAGMFLTPRVGNIY